MPNWCGCFAEKKQYLKIQKINHKALKVEYNNKENYDGLLRDNNEVSVHQSHLRALICKVSKSLNNLNPEFMRSYFVFKNLTFNIRQGPLLTLPAAKSTFSDFSVNFSQNKFRVIQSMSTLEQLAPIC